MLICWIAFTLHTLYANHYKSVTHKSDIKKEEKQQLRYHFEQCNRSNKINFSVRDRLFFLFSSSSLFVTQFGTQPETRDILMQSTVYLSEMSTNRTSIVVATRNTKCICMLHFNSCVFYLAHHSCSLCFIDLTRYLQT